MYIGADVEYNRMEITASMIKLIILLIVAVFAGVAALFAALGGIRRSAVNLLCMVVALVLALVLAAPLAEVIAGKLESQLGSSSAELAEAMPTLAALIDSTPRALLAPLIFGALFAVLAIIFAIVGAVVSRLVFRRNEWDRGAVSRLSGTCVGLISGLLVISVLLMPIAGYASMAVDTVRVLGEAEAAPAATGSEPDSAFTSLGAMREMLGALDKVTPVLSPLCEGGYMRILNAAGGNAVFDTLCCVERDGVRTPLSDILPRTAALVVDALPLTDAAPADYGAEQCAAIDALAADVEGDELVAAVIAEALAGVSSSWLEGRDFLGLQCPAMDARIRPVAAALMRSLREYDSKLLRENILSLAKVARLLIENKAIFSDGANIMDSIIAGRFALELLEAAEGCELLRSAAEAARTAGVGYVGDSLGLTADESAAAAELAGKIAESVDRAIAGGDATAAAEQLGEEIKRTAADYGIEISDELLPLAGEYILDAFENASQVTAEDILSMFASAAANAEN